MKEKTSKLKLELALPEKYVKRMSGCVFGSSLRSLRISASSALNVTMVVI